MRYLGIDYGEKRVGIAVSDEHGQFALPKKVLVHSARIVQDVLKCITEYKAEAIVIGESKDYKGAENPIMAKINSFKKELEGASRLPVYFEPEFMTSVHAERFQGKNDLHDASAAALILQSFLDRAIVKP